MPEMTEDKGTPEAAQAVPASSESQQSPTPEELQAQLEEAQATIRKLRRYERKYKAMAEQQEAEEPEPPQGDQAPDAANVSKLKDKLADAQRRLEALERERRDALLRAAVVAEASKLGFEYPEDVWGILNKAELDPDDPESITDLVKDIAKARPRWLRGSGVGVGQTAGGRRETDEEKRARLFGVGSSPFWSGGGVVMTEK